MVMTTEAEPEASSARLRALGYCRVSTKRQADHQVSLEEQQKKIDATCVLRDADLVKTFVEPGLSARSDRRPELQRMLEFACNPANRVDLVIVYAFSRFFRNVASNPTRNIPRGGSLLSGNPGSLLGGNQHSICIPSRPGLPILQSPSR